MSTIVIKRNQTLKDSQLSKLNLLKKAEKIHNIKMVIMGPEVTITNQLSYDKSRASYIIAKDLVEAELSKGIPIDDIHYELEQASNEIWYTSSDGQIVHPFDETAFGANIISNSYINNKGVIKFDGNLTKVDEDAFRRSETLSSISIPNGVTFIGVEAFRDCPNLIYVKFPDTLTEIREDAFKYNHLVTVTLPVSLSTIGNYAFQNGRRTITSLTSLNPVPPVIQENTFQGNYDYPIYVPANSVDAYKAADYWKSEAHRISAIPE